MAIEQPDMINMMTGGVAGGFAILGYGIKYAVDKLVEWQKSRRYMDVDEGSAATGRFWALLSKRLAEDTHLRREDHDRECNLKLAPMWKKLEEMHQDIKDIKRNGGGAKL